jgi:hypothetical protein
VHYLSSLGFHHLSQGGQDGQASAQTVFGRPSKGSFSEVSITADRSRSGVGNTQDSKTSVFQIVEGLPGEARELFFGVHPEDTSSEDRCQSRSEDNPRTEKRGRDHWDKRNPVRFYNYSYLKEILEKKHKVHVSLPTIIRRAKKMGITNKGLLEKPMTGRS